MGSHMAWRRKGVGEKAALSYIVVSGSIPDYLWGMILIFVFGVRFRIFPVQGNYDVMLEYEGWPWFLNVLYHAALPILAYSIVQIGPAPSACWGMTISMQQEPEGFRKESL